MPSGFIRALPKAELHLHLEGSVAPQTLVELRQRHGKQSTLAKAESLYQYKDFAGFLMAFKTLTEDLQTPDDYEFITYRLMEQLKAENVLHAEVYVSVGVCLWRKLDFKAIFEGLERGRERGEKDFGVSLLWIFDAVRQFGAEPAQKVFEFAAKYRERNVVAVGIGGDEQKAPPELHLGRAKPGRRKNWPWLDCWPGSRTHRRACHSSNPRRNLSDQQSPHLLLRQARRPSRQKILRSGPHDYL